MKRSIWDDPPSHGEILKKAWKHLDLGVIDRHHPFHLPVLGTTSANGTPNLRVVVLRRFWRRPPRLAFHTHLGSPKIDEVRRCPEVCWVFYHPDEKLQLRIRGTATVHTDDELADEQWLATGFFSRRCYTGQAPSEISKKATNGLPEGLSKREPSREESEAGRSNFAVVSTSVSTLDCMELDVRGNRRSLFSWTGDGEIEKKWLTP